MGKEIITLDKIKIEKHISSLQKSYFLEDMDISNILISPFW